jgi:hypothetical protein
MIRYFEKKKARDFIGSAVFIGAATITRYTGIAYPAAGFACLLFLGSEAWPRRLKKAFIFGLLSSLPFAAWIIRNIIRLHRPGASLAEMAFGDLGTPKIGKLVTVRDYFHQSAAQTVQWISDFTGLQVRLGPESCLAFILAVSIFAAGFFYLKKKHGRVLPNWSTGAAVLSIYAVTYFVFLIAYLRVSEQRINMDIRYLFFFFNYLAMIAFLFLSEFSRKVMQRGSRLWQIMIFFLALVVFSVWLWGSVSRLERWANQIRAQGADNTRNFSWFFVNTRHWLPPADPAPKK